VRRGQRIGDFLCASLDNAIVLQLQTAALAEEAPGRLGAVCGGLGVPGVLGIGGVNEREPEACAATRGRLDLHTTSVAVGDLPDDRQSEP
jgi:hypothetical protein